MQQESIFVFEEVGNVEERFTRCYDPEKIAAAKVESQMEYAVVSTGWWLVLKRLGLAMWIGHEKPAMQSGDTLTISIRKKDAKTVGQNDLANEKVDA